MLRLHLLSLLMTLLLAACASGPVFDTTGIARTLTPGRVAAEPQGAVGKQVLWGGVILSVKNLRDSTLVEMLGYPLDSDNYPDRDGKATGRFVLSQPGYLEPASYSEGRLLTVKGTVSDVESGRIGESDYLYPVIRPQQLHLWPERREYDGGGVHFGIGVGVGL